MALPLFVSEASREQAEIEQRYRHETAPVARELDLERHVLRHAAARGAPDASERADNVQRLQTRMANMKVGNATGSKRKGVEQQNRRLYTQPTIVCIDLHSYIVV